MTKNHAAIDAGHELIQAIGHKSWQDISELSTRRDQLIFSDNCLSEEQLKSLLAQNKVIHSALHEERAVLLKKSAQIGRGKNAHSAYESNRV